MRTQVLPFVLLLIAACSKPDEAKPADPAAVPSVATEAPSATPAAVPASAAPSTAPSATPSAAPSASTASGTKPAATGPACGIKPLPDCPLQAWMKANTAPAMAAGDMPALATAFDQIAKFSPPGYTNWTSIAKDGAKAGREAQLDAVKAACRTCHDQYKTKYKTEIRTRPLP